jgi:hypothetical protein
MNGSSQKINSLIFFVILLSILPTALFPQNKLLLSDSLKDSILYELSGLKAMDSIYQLCSYDRSGASRGLLEAQKWVMEKLKSWDIQDVRLDAFPADGEKIYLDTHPAGYAWEKKSAVLSLVEPYSKRIIDYAEIPTALVQYSNSADVSAEVVDVGYGLTDQDYAKKDVKGKIVLAAGDAYGVYPLAIKKYGAIGIVSSWENYEPDRSRFPDQVPWMSIPQEIGTHFFGFSVSRNIADELRDLISKGKVVVRAQVEAEIKKGNYYVLSSAIQGKDLPGQEILLMAHINHYKPAANDNASGCALLMEIERAIKSLIENGKIPPPRRTIRFLWMNEHTGSKIYLDSRPDLKEKGVMAMNLDMVGENVLLTESVPRMTLTPDSCPSFLDDLVHQLLQYVSEANFVEYRGTKIPFAYVLEKYNGAISDHYWYLSGGVSVPTSFLYVYPDNFYHSNEDTPDKCDPTMLKRLGFVTMAAVLFAASAGEEETLDLSSLVWAESSKRIIQAAKEGLDNMQSDRKQDLSIAFKEAMIKLEKSSEKEEKTLRSLYKLSAAKKVKVKIDEQCASIKRLLDTQRKYIEDQYKELCRDAQRKPTAIFITNEEKRYAEIVPVRHFRGPLNLEYIKTKISKEKSQWYDHAARRIPDFFVIQDEIANFVDDRNSILDIRNAVSAEFGPVALEDVFNFIDGIREAGFVTFLRR